MTQLHQQVKSILLPVLIDATNRSRIGLVPPDEDKMRKARELSEQLEVLGRRHDVQSNYRTFIKATALLILGLPAVGDTDIPSLEPYTVAKLGGSDKFVLVVHGRRYVFLTHHGEITEKSRSSISPVVVATNEEVEQYLNELNADQLRKIVSDDDYFAQFVDPIYNETTELVPETELREDDEVLA